VGTHLAYVQLHFLGDDVKEVYALGAKAQYPVWDDFIVLLRTSSDRWGIMEISWVAQESEIVYEIASSKGRRVQTFLFHGYTVEKNERKAAGWGDVLHNFTTDEKRLFAKWRKFLANQVKKSSSGHLGLIGNYVESLEKNIPPPVTGEDGRNAIRLLECIEESLNQHRPVSYSSW
jgi:predicted dehydrogenase